jgi:hypothetical protein
MGVILAMPDSWAAGSAKPDDLVSPDMYVAAEDLSLRLREDPRWALLTYEERSAALDELIVQISEALRRHLWTSTWEVSLSPSSVAGDRLSLDRKRARLAAKR